jgi:hypothetical protein
MGNYLEMVKVDDVNMSRTETIQIIIPRNENNTIDNRESVDYLKSEILRYRNLNLKQLQAYTKLLVAYFELYDKNLNVSKTETNLRGKKSIPEKRKTKKKGFSHDKLKRF